VNKTKIEWCDSTWNPATGCLHGCEYCYARKIADRFGGEYCYDTDGITVKGGIIHYLDKPLYKALSSKCVDGEEVYAKEIIAPYPYYFEPTFHKYRLEEPAKKTRGKNIFVCSMADLFGEWVPQEWINEVFDACDNAQQHNYLFLTKNAKGYERAIDNFACEDRGSEDCNELFKNFWFGVSITNQDDIYKADKLQELPEGHRFLSIEPIQGPIKFNINFNRCPICGSDGVYEDNPNTAAGQPKYYCEDCEWEGNDERDLKPSIEWIIIGVETGNRKNKIIIKKEWIDRFVEQCKKYNIPVFMKDSLISIVGEENMLREFPAELMR
jgi:protein gp37